MNILVVDDDEVVLTLVGRMLGGNGHRITATTDARQAIEAIERGDVDVLVADVEMPAMTGPQLVAEARRLRPGLPVLFMCGSPFVDGCTVLPKPFQAQDLLNAIHQALAFSDPNATSSANRANGGAGRPSTQSPPAA